MGGRFPFWPQESQRWSQEFGPIAKLLRLRTKRKRYSAEFKAKGALEAKPEIFSPDQGTQFTCIEFTEVLLDAKVQISTDGPRPMIPPT